MGSTTRESCTSVPPATPMEAIDRLYNDVLAFEEALGVCFGYVLHVGDPSASGPIPTG